MSNTQAKQKDPTKSKPSANRFLKEHTVVWKEIYQSYFYRKKYGVPKTGDGHPVLVIPGFMGSDFSTQRLRDFIHEMGYVAYGWEGGRNLGKHRQDIPFIIQLVEDLYKKHQEKVTIIGWSLGGVYTRQVAKAIPHRLRQIITMGAPFNGITQPNNAAWLFRLLNGGAKTQGLTEEWLAELPNPAPVPTTAIYSKDDGIVPWRTCMEIEEDALHQNIEIRGTHFGLGFNPLIWYIIANRLPLQENNWKWMSLASQPFEIPVSEKKGPTHK